MYTLFMNYSDRALKDELAREFEKLTLNERSEFRNQLLREISLRIGEWIEAKEKLQKMQEFDT